MWLLLVTVNPARSRRLFLPLPLVVLWPAFALLGLLFAAWAVASRRARRAGVLGAMTRILFHLGGLQVEIRTHAGTGLSLRFI